LPPPASQPAMRFACSLAFGNGPGSADEHSRPSLSQEEERQSCGRSDEESGTRPSSEPGDMWLGPPTVDVRTRRSWLLAPTVGHSTRTARAKVGIQTSCWYKRPPGGLGCLSQRAGPQRRPYPDRSCCQSSCWSGAVARPHPQRPLRQRRLLEPRRRPLPPRRRGRHQARRRRPPLHRQAPRRR